jgi:hypothetical protein
VSLSQVAQIPRTSASVVEQLQTREPTSNFVRDLLDLHFDFPSENSPAKHSLHPLVIGSHPETHSMKEIILTRIFSTIV